MEQTLANPREAPKLTVNAEADGELAAELGEELLVVASFEDCEFAQPASPSAIPAKRIPTAATTVYLNLAVASIGTAH